METKRRIELNRIRDQIRQTQKYIETDEATISRFRYKSDNLEYNSSQIAKLTAKNKERKAELDTLEQRSLDLANGSLDQEIIDAYNKSNGEVKRKSMETKQKKLQEKAENKKRSERSHAYYQSERNSDRKVKINKREMDRSHKHFVRVCDNIPDYMLKKLQNMPSNKGYIWRSIYCYGELPAEPGEPLVIFEKRDDTLIIHETTDTEYKIWHKKDKGRKTLHHSEKRNLKNTNIVSLMDYIR